MSQEIERKFLVKIQPDLSQYVGQEIIQGYVTGPNDTCEVRLRKKDTQTFLTVKSQGKLVRDEFETQITVEQFEVIWPATSNQQLLKTRYQGCLPCGTVFVLDEFKGNLAPLMLVEVEFTDVASAHNFQPPKWFGKEVTNDVMYKNKSLAFAQTAP